MPMGLALVEIRVSKGPVASDGDENWSQLQRAEKGAHQYRRGESPERRFGADLPVDRLSGRATATPWTDILWAGPIVVAPAPDVVQPRPNPQMRPDLSQAEPQNWRTVSPRIGGPPRKCGRTRRRLGRTQTDRGRTRHGFGRKMRPSCVEPSTKLAEPSPAVVEARPQT